MKLKELVNVKRGLVARAEEQGEIRYLRLADFNEEGQLQPGNERFLGDQPEEKYLLKAGDILMSILGPRYFALEFAEEEGKFIPNHFFNILNLKTDRFTSREIVEYLNSQPVQEELDSMTEGESIRTVPTKSLKDLRVKM
ncbi:MAG: hypothetical protein AAGA85_07290 [Bacteroidota bacterium]